MHYWADLQSVHRFRCCDNIVPNAKCQRVLVLALCLVEVADWTSRREILDVTIFGRLFVKRFALCYRYVVCPVCLSVTLMYCGQTVGRIKMKLGLQVGLGPGHIVFGQWGPSSPSRKGAQPPQFSAHTCCGQMAAWIKMSLSMEVGLGPGDFVLDGTPPLPKRGGD